MLDFPQMLWRLIIALALGAVIGLERELARKEAGIRTAMLVSGGAALFSIIALSLPYLVSVSEENIAEVVARNSGFLGIIANIVVGIGFLGAGIILKTEERVHGLTTAAVVWTTAAVGVLAGIGLIKFAFTSTVLITGLLYIMRKANISERVKED